MCLYFSQVVVVRECILFAWDTVLTSFLTLLVKMLKLIPTHSEEPVLRQAQCEEAVMSSREEGCLELCSGLLHTVLVELPEEEEVVCFRK